MAGRNRKTTSAESEPARKPADDRDDPSVAGLARGILAKEIRPRAADIRRLAEAVLARAGAKKKGKAGGGKKKDKPRPGKKGGSDKKDTKLAKIPGQKPKN